jgi:ABC-type antimicrobial peptide transport system ATPase subunit
MTQTYATHRRMDPAYHYVAFALWIASFAMAVRHLLQDRRGSIFELVLLVFLIIVLLKIRTYSLRVQDRVIRLEETLRMQALLPEALKGELHRLTPGQFVALRFASDGELAARVEEALKEGLKGEEIKKRIQTWRPDEFRV